MTTAPISYPEARATVANWIYVIQKAGPDVHGMTREKYVTELDQLKAVEKLLAAIVDHRAKGASRETGGEL